MFGSKLRSWMENHIVRPRKKGNKNKNTNCNVVAANTNSSVAAGSCHDVYKKTTSTGFTIYHGNGATTTTTTATSSATTSITAQQQNSTMGCGGGGVGGGIGNHNGCSSVIASPNRRREVSPIQNHTQSRYGWQSPEQETVTSPKSDNFLYAPQHHRVRVHQHYTAPNSKENSSEDKSIAKQPQQQPDCSSSSISSLSWSTGSKEPSMHSSSNNQVMSAKTVPAIEINSTATTPASNFQMRNESNSELPSLEEDKEDPNVVHYEEIHTILRHPEHAVNNNFIEHERPKSEQLTSFMPARSYQLDKTQDDASTRYGRLLPSKIHWYAGSCDAGCTGGSIDSLNANYIRGGSAECISSNNNYLHGSAYSHGPHYQNTSAIVVAHAQRNRLRAGRYVNPGMAGNATTMSGAATSVAGPLHSLSSPESAYSTGYSTDGTSPCAIYTPPEYYINMRTGTHYFPKSVNSLAIEAQRYKFGLNKIEEMSPIDPLPKTSFANAAGARKNIADFFENAANSVTKGEVNRTPVGQLEQPFHMLHNMSTVGSHSPVALQSTIVLPTLKGFESPSPRQRCRIRTNPWYSTTDTSSSGTTIGMAAAKSFNPTSGSSTISSSQSCMPVMKMELDAGSTSSSGIKSSNEAEGSSDKFKHSTTKTSCDSSESSSSLTEVENMQRTYSPNTIRRKRTELLQHSMTASEPVAAGLLLYTGEVVASGRGKGFTGECQEINASDDDATLNEMMGKFDESYVYEKETDILSSDSDPTNCPSDLDTGQDAGDECDTDELLDIDFIDTSSIQEICDRRDSQRNLGSCYYYNNSSNSPKLLIKQLSVRSRRNSRSQKAAHLDSTNMTAVAPNSVGSRRRKRFLKTRKKSSESRDNQNSPVRRPRESRSVGGTPVCLRRNQHLLARERVYKTSPLSNRSSSLVFTDVREKRFMTIAESEKALLRADMEADVKYKQLILEAESILVSMKSSVQSIPRETPVSSPRRVNPLANKRVEMLKNFELEAKREHIKQQQQQQQRSFDASSHQVDQELAAAINKRIELLKNETASAPSSPKSSRFSPRKTHLTNFISQNIPTEVSLRKVGLSDASKPPQSPQLQLNGRHLQSPNASPLQRRRYRSRSPKLSSHSNARTNISVIDSDSETDCSATANSRKLDATYNMQQLNSSVEDIMNRNYLPEIDRILLYDEADYNNQNTTVTNAVNTAAARTVSLENKTPALLSFNSVGGTMNYHYCPQSEPLKRKVYKGSSTFERIKKSLDLESEIPKQTMLSKVQRRRALQNSASKHSLTKTSRHELNHSVLNLGSEASHNHNEDSNKKQLILSTIADLKRSLENQSVELSGLNEEN